MLLEGNYQSKLSVISSIPILPLHPLTTIPFQIHVPPLFSLEPTESTYVLSPICEWVEEHLLECRSLSQLHPKEN